MNLKTVVCPNFPRQVSPLASGPIERARRIESSHPLLSEDSRRSWRWQLSADPQDHDETSQAI